MTSIASSAPAACVIGRTLRIEVDARVALGKFTFEQAAEYLPEKSTDESRDRAQ
jgi:hypothetical protein